MFRVAAAAHGAAAFLVDVCVSIMSQFVHNCPQIVILSNMWAFCSDFGAVWGMGIKGAHVGVGSSPRARHPSRGRFLHMQAGRASEGAAAAVTDRDVRLLL